MWMHVYDMYMNTSANDRPVNAEVGLYLGCFRDSEERRLNLLADSHHQGMFGTAAGLLE